MAKKKSKRPNLPQETLERARAEMRTERVDAVAVAQPAESAVAAPAKPKAGRRPASTLATRRIPTKEELTAEYSYVLSDLRNLFILAAILLISIVVIAVVLPRIVT
jgi:hypothetical protein